VDPLAVEVGNGEEATIVFVDDNAAAEGAALTRRSPGALRDRRPRQESTSDAVIACRQPQTQTR
jgi:hypothetical protein